MFAKYPDIGAIHYPSVAREGAMNLAIKPKAAHDALQIAGTSVLRVDDLYDHGLYPFCAVRSARRFDQDGRIA